MITRIARKFESVTIARIARGILNTVINTAKQGVSDLYKWSQARNGAFAKAVDNITQDFRYIADIVGTIFGPFIEALEPVVRRIADAFANATEKVNQFFAALLGRNGYYKALRVAKEYAGIQNQLLGFDELNVLNGSNGSGASGFEWIDYIPQKLSALGTLVTGIGLLEAAAGLVLLVMGHPWIGAALMAAGFSKVVAARTSDGSEISEKVNRTLGIISLIAGGAALALGMIVMPHNMPLGVALVAIGAAELVSAVALNWDGISEKISSICGDLTAFIGAELLVLGSVLLFANPAAWPLALGLLAAGAAGLAAAQKPKWDEIVKSMQDPLYRLTILLGASELALGAILLFSGAGTGIGLALMLAGAASLTNAKSISEWGGELITELDGVLGRLVEKINSWWKENITDKLDAAKTKFSQIFDRTYNVNYAFYPDGTMKTPHFDPVIGDIVWRAKGGPVDQGTLFYAGEAGPEVVTSFNNQSTVYNEDQLAGSLSTANQNVVAAVYDMANAIVSAIVQKDTGINVNDVLNAVNTQSLRYGL